MNESASRDQLRQLVGEALRLPEADRLAYVARRSGDSRQLRLEAETLLAQLTAVRAASPTQYDTNPRPHHPDSATFRPFQENPEAQGSSIAPTETTYPEFVGPYRILSLLGMGGMGAVYEAQQQKPRRIVALKVIRPGLVDRALLRRFDQEAELLGRLDHPGIARIYEAGVADTATGTQPFFAMELIRGRPLTKYANEQKLDVRQRLGLLAQLCDAVHYAHTKGIIHRDLKPANILVTEEGMPKVLDFGVARAAHTDVVVSMETSAGQIVGTLAYMSPEQAKGDARNADTRSDVYALGVIAYELMSGRLPFDVAGKQLHEVIRIITEYAPDRLSTTVRSLRGDVEMIIEMAMRKESSRRYQSAMQMADDVRNYLEGRPLLAGPESRIYRLRKVVARHRAVAITTTAAAIIVSVLLGFLVLSIISNKYTEAGATQERERAATAEKARIESEFNAAKLAYNVAIGKLDATRMDTYGGKEWLAAKTTARRAAAAERSRAEALIDYKLALRLLESASKTTDAAWMETQRPIIQKRVTERLAFAEQKRIEGQVKAAFDAVDEVLKLDPTNSAARALSPQLIKMDEDGEIVRATQIPRFEAQNATLGEAVDALSKSLRVTAHVDWKQLEECGFDRSTRASLLLSDSTAQSILELICDTYRLPTLWLDFDVAKDSFTISSAEIIATKTLVTRIYDIQGLAENERAIEDLIRAMQELISPDSWRDQGGLYGSIKWSNGKLLIVQTKKTHRAIPLFLANYPTNRSKQKLSAVESSRSANADKSFAPGSATPNLTTQPTEGPGHREAAVTALRYATEPNGAFLPLSDSDRISWRNQALSELQDEVAERKKEIDSGNTDLMKAAGEALHRLQTEPGLAPFRDEESTISRLPFDESKAWRALWAEIGKLREKASKGG